MGINFHWKSDQQRDGTMIVCVCVVGSWGKEGLVEPEKMTETTEKVGVGYGPKISKDLGIWKRSPLKLGAVSKVQALILSCVYSYNILKYTKNLTIRQIKQEQLRKIFNP